MGTDHHTTRLLELTDTISKSTAEIREYLVSQGSESPSLDEDAPSLSLSDEAASARDNVLDAMYELHDLLLDPFTILFHKGAHNETISLQAISHFGIAQMVPAGGQATFKDIAERTGVGENMTRRLLQHAISRNVFKQSGTEAISHTKISKFLAQPANNNWMRLQTEDMWLSAVKLLDALKKWPNSAEPNESAFSLANDSTDSIYEVIGKDPVRAQRFASAMKAAADQEINTVHLLEYYNWESLGTAKVVDIGGSQGHVAIALARKYGGLSVVVQDNSRAIETARVPDGLEGRVEFMPHDFFQPQTVAADVYHFRRIMHNWSDKYCVRILRALVPALRPGVRVVIQDSCIPEPGEGPAWKERDLRAVDLSMAALFNGKERTVAEWKTLFTEADERLVFSRVIYPQGSSLAIVEAIWDDANY